MRVDLTVRSDLPISAAICFCVAVGFDNTTRRMAISSKVQFLHFEGRLSAKFALNMQLSVAETMLFAQQHTAEEAFQIDGCFCYPFLLNEIAREYYIQGACKSRQGS